MSSEGDASTATPVQGSFRDPAGRVLAAADGSLLRTVAPAFGETYDAVVATGLYDVLIERGLLVAHEEVAPDLVVEDVHALLRPARVPFVSYPYEWSPAQLRAAALHTLTVAEVALEHGCVLRDASAYNVQFLGTRPVFIDTLSFEPWDEGEPWAAYGQFCRHFLAPLALQVLVDHRLADLLRTNIDGVDLGLASRLLPLRSKLRPGLLVHVHAHARASRRSEVDPDAPRRTARVGELALRGTLDGLRGAVSRLEWRPPRTAWGAYYEEDSAHYSDGASDEKQTLVRRMVEAVAPETVFDLGANTGRFSRIAAASGADVVALDVDHGAVEAGHLSLVEEPVAAGSVLALRYDMANPSPALGWATDERSSLLQRGPADLVMALALVHHLAVGNNVPLGMVAAHLAALGRHAVVEWVPPDDRKVRVLMATRQRSYDDYTTDDFRRAFEEHFVSVEDVAVGDTGRVLHLLRSRR